MQVEEVGKKREGVGGKGSDENGGRGGKGNGGLIAMEGMEIEGEGIHMVGSKEECTFRHSKILKIPTDFHLD